MKKVFYVTCRESVNKAGVLYYALMCDFPYKKGVMVTTETDVILMLSGLSFDGLYSIKKDERKEVVL